MIHEIFDYLLTRSLLLNCSEQELIDSVDNEETFAYILDNIYNIMQEENYIIISPMLKEKVINFISKYRFDYIKNNNYCEKMNYIIKRVREYNQMSDKRKKDILNNWVEQESNLRGLPKRYQNPRTLFDFIMMDAAYISGMLNIGKEFEISVPIEFASIINIVMNRAPEIFEEEPILLEYAKFILGKLQTIKGLRFTDTRMLKNTYNIINEKYDKSEDVELEISYSLKKTKK